MTNPLRPIAIFICCSLGVLCPTVAAVDWRHYDNNPEFQPQVMANGGLANLSELQRVGPYLRMGEEVSAQRVTEKVWIITGFFYGPVVIETAEGLLVFSTGEHAGEGRLFRKVIREQISTKPVIAVFYDHAHYSKGAATLLDGDDALIVAHPDANRFIEQYGQMANPTIEDLLPTLDGRAKIHFGTHHPNTGPDAKSASLSLELGHESARLAATRTLDDGEVITIGGIDIQAFHAITDTEDVLTFWLPEQKIVIDNVLWPTIPNLYTLRGDRFRNPTHWMDALKKIRELEPEIELSVGGGSAPLYGKDTIIEATNAVLDATAFIYDQTIRLTNLGIPAGELRHHIQLPEHLSSHPFVNQAYGQYEAYPQAIAQENHGWFSGYAEDLHRLPRHIHAQRLTALVGGETALYQAALSAQAAHEYVWAKELAVQLYYLDPGNEQYRGLLATIFRKLGQMSPGTITRHFYLAAALSLEDNGDFSIASVQTSDWVKQDIGRAVNHLRTRINPERARDSEGLLAFRIDGASYGLHIRRGIAEYVSEPAKHYRQPDAVISTSADTFSQYFRGELSAEELMANSAATETSAKLLQLFDEYQKVPLYPRHPLQRD
ncbi:MAG: alkyl sulfatase dimerization domain-containing protein [Haliea sp.]|jgi:alkyl sulfatase BDS1-like metallo-beta-lactamase superfamily hydrolase